MRKTAVALDATVLDHNELPKVTMTEEEQGLMRLINDEVHKTINRVLDKHDDVSFDTVAFGLIGVLVDGITKASEAEEGKAMSRQDILIHIQIEVCRFMLNFKRTLNH